MAARAITVFTTVDGRPCNKIITRSADGSINKARAKSSRYTARTVAVDGVAALAGVIRGVGSRADQMISLSLFDDSPADEWQVWACWDLAEALGCDKGDRAALAGFHLIGETWVAARIKESMRLGSFLLFDRDMSEGMPKALADLEVDDWRAAAALLFPGADTCGCVLLPSTSNRIVVDGVGGRSRACHMIVEVDDPELIEGAWDQATHRSLITSFAPAPWDDEVPLAFAKPVYERKNGTGKLLRHSWWTIFDRSTWSVGREVFDGAPSTTCPGVTILPPEVEHRDGPPLALAAVDDLTRAEKVKVEEAVRAITGVRPAISLERTPGRDGKMRVCRLSITVPDLELGLDVEQEDGSWTTVRAIMATGATHVRLQTPFRESVSMAAFYGVHADGTPFIFDMGTSEKHVLARLALKPIWQHLSEWLVAEYRPVFLCLDAAFFSEEQGRKVGLRDVRPTPEIMAQLRLASNTPLGKDGVVKENALPTEFNKWLPVAWSDCVRALPAEVDARITSEAGELFKAQLAGLLTTQVQSDHGGRWLKRALGTWCHYYATLARGKWARVGTYHAWGRICDDGAFQVGIGSDLARQVSARNHVELAALNNLMLTKLCRLYGIMTDVGDNRVYTRDAESTGRVRMTVLATGYVATLDLSYDHDDPHAAGIGASMNGDAPSPGEKGPLDVTH